MKQIVDVRKEIRNIREVMDKRLEELEKHLLQFKIEAVKETEFQWIYEIASLLPLIEHPITKMDMNTKSNYMGILLFFCTWKHTMSDDQKLFLQRITLSDSNAQTLDIFFDRLEKISIDSILYKLDEKIVQDFARELVLDLLILIYLSEKRDDAEYLGNRIGLLADIAEILKIQRSKLSVIAEYARAIFTQDLDAIRFVGSQYDWFSLFRYYLAEIPNYKSKAQQNITHRWSPIDSYLIGGNN